MENVGHPFFVFLLNEHKVLCYWYSCDINDSVQHCCFGPHGCGDKVARTGRNILGLKIKTVTS